ncbi:uncharacterized protein K489DRAFT_153879 [Dissoconium aciculare CBS 342.82]|uniref:Uncharacterized protein n=1 Tax=Dissoconium aciculare CBS 342.82 TaxID=1314786 RepID=A0A6J3MB81_9PEZI|nr:uncharacterized protein K489DRAFT_153879 [Dissoconium aciculare CBS 342.82]KAF1825281.1 hypothetical protein K489DRAFT_153879 [Dissoconium aciculare CBS 342.82]
MPMCAIPPVACHVMSCHVMLCHVMYRRTVAFVGGDCGGGGGGSGFGLSGFDFRSVCLSGWLAGYLLAPPPHRRRDRILIHQTLHTVQYRTDCCGWT